MISPVNSFGPSRSHIRLRLRHFRRSLSAHQQQKASFQLCLRFARNSIFARARHVAFYLPNDGELSLLPLLEIALKRHKKCFLPRVDSAQQSMEFVRYRKGDRLRKGRFGIAEPGPRLPAIDLAELDLIMMPLVGFDRCGNRLGMGGGFYDRTLAAWRRPRSLTLMGIAHSGQEVSNIQSERWDIPLHIIATEKGLRMAAA